MTPGSGGSGEPSPSRSPGTGVSDVTVGDAAGADIPRPRAATGVLADRIAAALVHREPGWRLPRRSALARRYNVSMAEIDAAISELARRSLIRRLPDGQLYRASPAEYLIPVEGIGELSTRLDPMGGEVTCQAWHISQRDAPQDVTWALGAEGEGQVRIVRSVWATDGEPVAIATSYVPEQFAGTLDDTENRPLTGLLVAGPSGGPARATAIDLEMVPPQPSVARSLGLVPGQSAVSVTIRFDDTATGTPAGLTVLSLKPEHFRVVVHAGTGVPRAADQEHDTRG
ncbi:MAG: UTRA domain-containing protein [Streptosporangiales bacterium]|nr:UTRA domain-containing protein [Streptosporangiales bacterium]